MNPRDLGVPHKEWRTHQYETLQKIQSSEAKHIFVEAPTGCGKTALSTALGHGSQALALVATHGLIDQYSRDYAFTPIKGRQTYPCADPDKIADWELQGFANPPTAFDCHHAPMTGCEYKSDCPYLFARWAAQRSQRVVMTYKYAALASWVQDRGGILVCDEGHATAEEILGCTDFSITDWHTRRYNVPPPKDYFHWRIQETITGLLKNRVEDYLSRVYAFTRHFNVHADKSPHNAAGMRFHLRVGTMIEELSLSDNWFLDASPSLLRLRPLDARPIAKKLWVGKEKTVLMSATIGDPGPLANELGIDTYDHIVSPHLIPVDKRPIYNIFNYKMTKRERDNNPGLYRAQAAAISHFIQTEIPENWRGIILTTSYDKIKRLREGLSGRLNGRIWEAPSSARGVTDRITAFLTDPSPGIIAIDTIQGWGHGLDLRGDLGRFVIVAGVPHSNPSDPFDRARIAREGGMRYARWCAYNSVVQACGRVTRGVKVDGEYMMNVAALADAGAMTNAAKRYYPAWFLEAIV